LPVAELRPGRRARACLNLARRGVFTSGVLYRRVRPGAPPSVHRRHRALSPLRPFGM
jgi:hypothetical protein